MPKDTFLSLPKEKKVLITEIAIEEFYEKGYEKASISHIVEQANIAKGSFYQYFEHLEDLYQYILIYASQIKADYLKELLIETENLNFYDSLNKVLWSSVRFFKGYPKLARIIEDYLKSNNEKMLKEIPRSSVQISYPMVKKLLLRAQEKNEIRTDMDVDFIYGYLSYIMLFLTDYLLKENKDLSKLDDAFFQNGINQMIHLIEFGISKNYGNTYIRMLHYGDLRDQI
jgi:AcrR family transcriptional regulator